jgi:hypothetical protein
MVSDHPVDCAPPGQGGEILFRTAVYRRVQANWPFSPYHVTTRRHIGARQAKGFHAPTLRRESFKLKSVVYFYFDSCNYNF